MLWHLRNKNTLSSMDAIRNYRITRLAAIIYSLRKDGHKIETMMKKSKHELANTYAEYRYLGWEA